MVPRSGTDTADLRPAEAARLEALRSATSLDELRTLTGADTEHDAYFEAKREWFDLRNRTVTTSVYGSGIPGDAIDIDGHTFWIHGISHASTAQEREYLNHHVATMLDRGATVYCEQGIRSMYFDSMPGVCEMDDYWWAKTECELLESSAISAGVAVDEFDGLLEELDTFRSRVVDAAFSVIDRGGDVYGDQFTAALGDLVTDFMVSHEQRAIGRDFESHRRSKVAAEDPEQLAELQEYYKKVFLPQPIEREWLRRHDPELEIVTHARNERMADYVVYHADDADEVHLIVGAAHQPGVGYYLERHREGSRSAAGFQLAE